MSLSLVKKSLNIVESTATTSKSVNAKSAKNSGKIIKAKDGKKNAVIAVEKIRKSFEDNKAIDKVALNVEKLKKLSEAVRLPKKLEAKIANRISLSKSKGEKGGKREEGTAFTEEDFAKFERERFVK